MMKGVEKTRRGERREEKGREGERRTRKKKVRWYGRLLGYR